MIPTLLTDSITFDLDRAIHYTLLWGLEAVEIRSVGGPRNQVPFVNEEKLKRRLAENDLPALAVIPGMFEGELSDRPGWLNELALLDELLFFCERIDCPQIVISSFRRSGTEHFASSAIEALADALLPAAEKAHQRSIRLCVANQDEGYLRTGSDLARLFAVVDHPALMAAWYPDQAAIAGERPGDGLDAISDRIGVVRCRNVSRVGNAWEARTIDSGAVDWADQVARLTSAGYSGPISLEVRAEPRIRNGLRESSELVRMVRSAE